MKIVMCMVLMSLALVLSGCATKEETSGITTQLTALQDSLSQESQKVADLEIKVEALAREVQSLKAPAVSEAPKMTLEDIKKVQLALTAAGFDPGKADGKMGPQTVQAIKNFQEANGLKVDGVVGKGTWEKLQEVYLEAVK